MSDVIDCTEQEIKDMVHEFYAVVREDSALGPIFNSHIEDWDEHLDKLVDFWSSILLRTGRFSGSPMPKHIALKNLSAELFMHWLALFRETTAAQENQAMGDHAYAMAERIAQSLWYGYQIGNCPHALPKDLELS